MCSNSSDALVAMVMAVSEIAVEGLSSCTAIPSLFTAVLVYNLSIPLESKVSRYHTLHAILKRLVVLTSIAVSTMISMVLWHALQCKCFIKWDQRIKIFVLVGNSEVSGCLSNHMLALMIH